MEVMSMKQEAHRLLDKLPEDATWDDLMYQDLCVPDDSRRDKRQRCRTDDRCKRSAGKIWVNITLPLKASLSYCRSLMETAEAE